MRAPRARPRRASAHQRDRPVHRPPDRAISATTALPTTTASACSASARACSGAEMPNPTATGARWLAARTASSRAGRSGGSAVAGAGHPGDAHEVEEATGALADAPQALGRRGRSGEQDQREVPGSRGVAERSGLLQREVGDDEAVHAHLGRAGDEGLRAHADDGVHVAHQRGAGPRSPDGGAAPPGRGCRRASSRRGARAGRRPGWSARRPADRRRGRRAR